MGPLLVGRVLAGDIGGGRRPRPGGLEGGVTRSFAPGPRPPWQRWDRHYDYAVAHFWCAVYGPLSRRRYHLRAFSMYASTLGWPLVWAFNGP